MAILLTGVTGFIGSAVFKTARSKGLSIVGVVRNRELSIKSHSYENELISVPSLDKDTDWGHAFVGVDVVIHCAAIVNNMQHKSYDSWEMYRSINVEGTLNLARQAAMAGVKRFVFISSIKVNGELTSPGKYFMPSDEPCPQDYYGLSKSEAEKGLRELALRTGMEVVIIRPPLVYGPGVKGNFLGLMRLIKYRIPLPLGAAINNRRSFIAIDNLVDLILICVLHPRAANQTFLVSDGVDISTVELIKKIALVLRKPVFLMPLPVVLLNKIASICGRGYAIQRLFGSLQLDISKTRELLCWTPPFSIDEGLHKMLEKNLS